MEERTFAEINLDAVSHNMSIIKKYTSAMVMCVVKANAYGHGVKSIAETLSESGADYFAVAAVDEGVELRNYGIEKPCVILGYSDCPEKIISNNLIPAIFDINTAKRLSKAAVNAKQTVKIHIALDTGMSRIGFDINNMKCNDSIIEEIKCIAALPYLEIDGIFSHFTTADEQDGTYTRLQFERFCSFTKKLESCGVNVGKKHICNSAATMLYPEMHLDMVRPGIVLYGLKPSDYFASKEFGFIPAMELKSSVTRVQDIAADRFVGYGNTFKTTRKTRLVTVGIGYADGYFRALSNKAYAVCNGKIIKIAGRICMDQCMFDATCVNNISVGDHVVLFGREPLADDIAEIAGTIGYELVCAVSRRVPRIYYKNGEITGSVNFLLENIAR